MESASYNFHQVLFLFPQISTPSTCQFFKCLKPAIESYADLPFSRSEIASVSLTVLSLLVTLQWVFSSSPISFVPGLFWCILHRRSPLSKPLNTSIFLYSSEKAEAHWKTLLCESHSLQFIFSFLEVSGSSWVVSRRCGAVFREISIHSL